MAEWSIAPVLKTDVLRGTGGSNPSLSANIRNNSAVSQWLAAELFLYIYKKGDIIKLIVNTALINKV